MYQLSARAHQDIDEITLYIWKHNPRSAKKWLDHIFSCFELLNRFPFLGRTRPDLTSKPLYFWPSGKYIVAYQVNTHIEIVRVLSTYRDLRKNL